MKNKTILIAPSILSADFSCLSSEVQKVEKAGAQWLHIDVMDGHFVPNITIGPVVVKWLKGKSKLFFDTHLMIARPDRYWQEFQKAGSDLITIHSEVRINKRKLLMDMKKAGLNVGMSLRPRTPIASIMPYMGLLDLVLVMTVEPGFGGQAFMYNMLPRIKKMREIINKNKFRCILEVDGGINVATVPDAVRNGAEVLVAGNSVFGLGNPLRDYQKLQRIIDKTRF